MCVCVCARRVCAASNLTFSLLLEKSIQLVGGVCVCVPPGIKSVTENRLIEGSERREDRDCKSFCLLIFRVWLSIIKWAYLTSPMI
ncbi:hypothetical protein CCUS01_14451 [Colletotrichum cuscutae]|uniref:Secreted protein n=1 Tax=Colletotrichum cuscutae TaxID=1209917 RepID=A0AAI9Y951_9PEZI|nr:hypothetical protein CCUS01_14451 [Colletotrichum cuscutae]